MYEELTDLYYTAFQVGNLKQKMTKLERFALRYKLQWLFIYCIGKRHYEVAALEYTHIKNKRRLLVGYSNEAITRQNLMDKMCVMHDNHQSFNKLKEAREFLNYLKHKEAESKNSNVWNNLMEDVGLKTFLNNA